MNVSISLVVIFIVLIHQGTLFKNMNVIIVFRIILPREMIVSNVLKINFQIKILMNVWISLVVIFHLVIHQGTLFKNMNVNIVFRIILPREMIVSNVLKINFQI